MAERQAWKLPEAWRSFEVGGVPYGQVHEKVLVAPVERVRKALSGWKIPKGSLLEKIASEFGEALEGAKGLRQQDIRERELTDALESNLPYAVAGRDVPEAEITETIGPEGEKRTVTKVAVGGKSQKESVDRSGMYAALSQAMQPAPRPDLGFSLADVKVPKVGYDVGAANERARAAYAPFSIPPGTTSKGWAMVHALANAFSQTQQQRELYFNALDRNFQLASQQEMQREEAKRTKMMSQLQEEQTLAQLQKYRQQQAASEQLAQMVTQYQDQIFTDPELNMGAAALMDLAGGAAGAMRIPTYKPNKPSQFDLFYASEVADARREGRPTPSVQDVTAAFAAAKRKGTLETELQKRMFPTDPAAKMQGMDYAARWLDSLSDPDVINDLESGGVNIQRLVRAIDDFYGHKTIEGRRELLRE